MAESLSFLSWLALAGGLLLAIALTTSYLHHLPVSSAAVYLLVGVLIGPTGAGWLRVDLQQVSGWAERLTELAVILSLFIGGLRLRTSLRAPQWRAAFRLAGPVMLMSILAVAVLGHLAFDLSPAHALLLGAIIAPTDPVLASAVSVHQAADRDHMRYGLSGEAGLNDGLAFPFVMLGLGWQKGGLSGEMLGSWFVREVLWAVPIALCLGFFAAKAVGRLVIHFRSRHHESNTASDFFSLALVALTYVAAETIGSWGFLAVFAAGVGLRHAELHVVAETPHPQARDAVAGATTDLAEHPPAEDLVGSKTDQTSEKEPAVAAGVLVGEVISFGGSAERLLEVMLVVLVGVSTAFYWSGRAALVALALILVMRPFAVQLALIGTPTTRAQRWLMGWFGIRGVGSLYYLAYALNHGLSGHPARILCEVVFTVVAVSIALHGLSGQPLLALYERGLAKAGAR